MYFLLNMWIFHCYVSYFIAVSVVLFSKKAQKKLHQPKKCPFLAGKFIGDFDPQDPSMVGLWLDLF